MDWEYLIDQWITLVSVIPVVIAWTVGIIIAVRLFKRDGGPAERLLLVGCCLMLGDALLGPLITIPVRGYLLSSTSFDAQRYGLIITLTSLPFTLMSLAGIVCLVIAFWKRWKTYGPTVSSHTGYDQINPDQD